MLTRHHLVQCAGAERRRYLWKRFEKACAGIMENEAQRGPGKGLRSGGTQPIDRREMCRVEVKPQARRESDAFEQVFDAETVTGNGEGVLIDKQSGNLQGCTGTKAPKWSVLRVGRVWK